MQAELGVCLTSSGPERTTAITLPATSPLVITDSLWPGAGTLAIEEQLAITVGQVADHRRDPGPRCLTSVPGFALSGCRN